MNFKKKIKNFWQKNIKKPDKPTYLFLIFLVFFFFAISTLTIQRWNQFEYYYFDHGIFDQSLWSVAHGRWPLFDHIGNYQLNQLGDHFTPSLYLLAPIYWLTNSYVVLLIIQNILICASFFVLFLIGRHLKIKTILIFAIIFSLSIFVGFQNGVISGFHTEFPALLTLGLTFLFYEKEKYGKMLFFLLITLGFKEIFVVLVATFGFLILMRKKWKYGLFLVFFAVLYYFLSTRLIIPFFSGNKYGYQLPDKSFFDYIKSFFLPEMKIKTILASFANFGFLPLLSLGALPIIIQEFFIRFVFTTGTHSWDLGMHYNLISAYILAYLSLLGAVKLPNKIVVFFSIFIVIFSLILNYKLNSPILMILNKDFYLQAKNTQFLHDFVKKIPRKGLLMTQNNIVVRLTHNNNEYYSMLLRQNYWQFMPDIIALDIRQGQSANNYWPADVYSLYEGLNIDPNYTKKNISDEQVYFEKNPVVDMNYYTKFIDK